MLLINEIGAREIREWLEDYSNFGYITAEMVSTWCAKAEEMNDGHIELKAHWSKDRTVHTYTVSDEGMDIVEEEAE